MQNSAPSPYGMGSYGVPSPASSVGSTIYDMNVQSPDSYIAASPTNQPRQRLRPWLTDQINEGKTPGLEWVNKDKHMFKIPWKHFGRPGVDQWNDAMLFRNWAIHTKRWHEGEPSDISTWKTRFRCALTKLQDIVELSHMHQTEGEEPFRVYQFKEKDDTPRSKTSKMVNQPIGQVASVYPVMGNYQPNHVDVANENCGVDALFGDDLELPSIDGIEDLDKLLKAESNFNENNVSPSVTPTPSPTNIPPQQSMTGMNQPVLATLQPSNIQNSLTSLQIKMFYEGKEIGEKIVDNLRGLRIAFNQPPPLPDNVIQQETSEMVSHIYGPFQAEQIYFPPIQDTNTLEVLEMTKRGLVLQARNGEILATRLCRAKIFYSDSASPTSQPRELPREHTTAVFDYKNDFLPKFIMYMQGQGPLPTAERYFSFAQRCSAQTPMNSILVYVSVTHILAQRQVNQMQVQRPDILVSDPNMLDHIANQIEQLSMNNT